MRAPHVLTAVAVSLGLWFASPMQAQISCTDCLVEFKTAFAKRPKVGKFAYVFNNLPKREVYKTYTYESLWEENYDGDMGTSKNWNAKWEQAETHNYDPDDFTLISGSTYECQNYSTTSTITDEVHKTTVTVAEDGSETEENVIATYNFSTDTWDSSCKKDFFHDPNDNCYNDMSFGGLTKVVGTASDDSPADTATTHTVITDYARYSGYERKTTITETLSDEYTTDELIDNLNADLDTALASAGWTGSGSSSLYLPSSEACAEADKMIYRFKLPAAEADVEYEISWQEVFRRDGGTSSATDKSEIVVGEGGLTYGIEHTGEVPSENGIVTVENISVEIHSNGGTNGGGGPPGSGSVGFGGGSSSYGGDIGCGPCAGGGIGIGNGAFASISMGQTGFGRSAGNIYFATATATPVMAKPKILFYNVERPDIDIVRVEGDIHQIKTHQVLAHVDIINDYKFEIQFYYDSDVGTKSGETYPLINFPTPFVTWRFENPDASPTIYNKLKVTEIRGVISRVWEYTYSSGSNHTWVLTKPGSIQEEELVWSADGQSPATREVTIEFRKPAGANELVIYRKYQEYSWGEGMIEESIGEGAEKQTTTYTYLSTALYGSARPVEKIVHHDGSWQWFTYTGDNLPSIVYSSYGNQAPTTTASLCRKVEYNYTSPSGSGDVATINPRSARIVDEYVLGEHVSRRFTIFRNGERLDIVCQTVSTSTTWNAGDNLVTTTTYYTSGANEDRVKSIEYPDGTAELYTYSESTNFTTNVSRGVPNTSPPTAITDGTTTTTVVNEAGFLVSRTVVDIGSSKTLSSETYDNHDEFGRPQETEYLDLTTTEANFSCCGIDNTVGKDGLVTSYYYDDLNRQIASLANGILHTNVLNSVGNVLVQIRKGTDSSEIVLNQSAYDTAGQTITVTNALGGITSIVYEIENSRQKITTTYPDSGQRVEYYYRDGRVEKVYGDATTSPVKYVYGVEDHAGVDREYRKEIKLTSTGSDTSEWTKTYFDAVGREFKTVFADSTTGTEADNPYSQRFYNSLGQLSKTRDPDGVITLYVYDAKGELVRQVADLDQDGVIDTSGTDRISDLVDDIVSYSSTDVMVQTNFVFTTNTSSVTNKVSISRRSTDGLKSWQSVFKDQSTEVITSSQTVYPGSGVRTETTTYPDSSSVVKSYSYGRLSTVTRKNSSGGQVTKATYAYDVHGRVSSITDERNGATKYFYNKADQVTNSVSPAIGIGLVQQTQTAYDSQGRVIAVTQPDGTITENEYFENGLISKTFGSRTYPVEYTYDDQGRLKTMKTWKDYSGASGAAITTWNYDPYRGWLTSKDYPDSSSGSAGTLGPTYTYKPSGRLDSRTWERSGVLTKSYHYNSAGDLDSIVDGETTERTFSYDRRGRLQTVAFNGITTTFSYNDANQKLSESYSGGSLDGLSVHSGYDSELDRISLTSKDGSTTLDTTTYTYDTAGRISSVTSDTHPAIYGYLGDSRLIETVTFKNDAWSDRLITTRTFDKLNRLTAIASEPVGGAASSLPLSYAYDYNQANQRVRRTDANGSYWVYIYDKLGQVISGKRYWADGFPVDGQQFEYSFDDIGNRQETGGRESAESTYTSNYLNQYSQRTVSDKVDVHGIANPTASVTVNSNTADRKGEYFHYPLTVNNSSTAQYPTVTVTSNYGGTQSSSGEVYVPQTPESFSYDDDGNLTADGRWTYTWDNENRLTEMKRDVASPVGARLRMTFEYDYQGRRIRKRFYTYSGSWVEQTDMLYLYDGWNVIAELNANSGNAKIRTYMWGIDLSGSEQGAGGVGGLLKIKDYTSGTKHYFVAYDGNGNVMGLVDAADGSVDAVYEYGPFGEPLRATGSAAANPIRFSSKYADSTSGLLYYGYRYYNPQTGRWLNRDPIGEEGNSNVYGFVNNNSLSQVDLLGLCRCSIIEPLTVRLEIPDHYRAISRIEGKGPIWDGDDAQVMFTMKAVFANECCEFRQKLRSHIRYDGEVKRKSDKEFKEDKDIYSGKGFSRENDPGDYETRPDGSVVFSSDDWPGGAGYAEGREVSVWMSFIGYIVDICPPYSYESPMLMPNSSKYYGFMGYGTSPSITVKTWGFQ